MMARKEGKMLDLMQTMDKLLLVPGEVKHAFITAQTDKERVEKAFSMLSILKILPSSQVEDLDHGKSQKKSEELRNTGNAKYSEQDFISALDLYTRSLASAPVASLEYVLALSNRSMTLLKLGQYKACLADVGRATLLDLNDKLKSKLLARKQTCEMLAIDKELNNNGNVLANLVLDDTTSLSTKNKDLVDAFNKYMVVSPLPQVASELPQLTYRAHNTLFGASECISVKRSQEMGRYIEAVAEIKPGDVILIEDAFASVLWQDHYNTHCYHCMKLNPAMIPCLHCSMVMYCSEDCRTKSWDISHSVECAILPALVHINKVDNGWTALMALRILLVTLANGNTDLENLEAQADSQMEGFDSFGQFIQDRYTVIHHLPCHKPPGNHNAARAVLAAIILDLLMSRTTLFSNVYRGQHFQAGGLILHYLNIATGNPYRVTEQHLVGQGAGIPMTVEIGSALYSTSSLMNHSCAPNVFRTYRGSATAWIAIEFIKKGTQVFSDYGQSYLYINQPARQIALMDYCFNCQCKACIGHWPLKRHLPNATRIFICVRCGTDLCDAIAAKVKCSNCKKTNHLARYKYCITQIKYEQISMMASVKNHRTLLSSCSIRLAQMIALLCPIVKSPDVAVVDCQELLQDSFMQGGSGNKPQ